MWGTRGSRFGGHLSEAQEITYFLDWVQSHFPTAIWLIGGSENRAGREIEQELISNIDKALRARKRERDFIFDKRWLIRSQPRAMPNGHGGAGPLMRVEAQIVVNWVNALKRNQII